ncbi:aminodeoxychorismate/anthranilate synthase component II [Bifidobacterium sp. ESL0800]|uniref:anthranilate synthase component II n=1 Tax=Bifidobacterium sp. ESL0800 TaxID=2983236 RepID=UPI0023F90FA1|nr:aminodeoxychorismate/anthranilate synthase component II [Bifidobacterium sp. ESL0800]WEV75551.1 aminodeoxychorismate/anthranilate synthase component II [Bifidobacterium sp. ESL0800]
MITIVDNYDSFSYNLYQLIGSIDPDVRVVRNDDLDVAGLAALGSDGIVLSPGPGKPADAGICEDVVREMGGKVPILGVCLGHQAICEALGGKVVPAAELMHGKASPVELDNDCPLFAGMPSEIQAARYHSLEADKATLPETLRVVARTLGTDEIMAVSHVADPTFGVQFHPESILTPQGSQILRNFIDVVDRWRVGKRR